MRSDLQHNSAQELKIDSGKLGVERKALTGNVTLTPLSPIFSAFDPGGADRTITLPAFERGRFFFILHRGTANTLTVKDVGGTTVLTIYPNELHFVGCDESSWYSTPDVFTGSGASASTGLVPQPPSSPGILKYLCEDGTWRDPGFVGDFAYGNISDGTNTATASGVDTIRFRSADNKITVTVGSNDLTFGDNVLFTLNQGNIDHNSLLNYVADQHVAHSSVTFTAGVALTGGGTIAANRTIDWDPTEPSSATPALGDTFAFFSAAGSAVKKALLSAINAVLDHDVLTNFVANKHIDHTLVSVQAGTGLTGGGTIAATRTLSLDINSLSSDTLAAGDKILFYDISGSDHNVITFSSFNTSLDHDVLVNFVANKHIDHTTVSITGNNGLTGGGDISSSRTIGVANDGITFARMQNISTDVLIGRDTAASGDPEEITLNSTLSFTGSGSIQRAALTGDATASAGSNAVTVVQASGAFALTGVLTPSTITADQNDYNPTNLSTAGVLRLASDALRNITGLAGGATGRILFVHNVGSNNIVLKDESASSSAANRFALTADVTLSADSVAVLQYDNTSQRWRCVSGGGGGGSFDINALSAETAIAIGDYVAIYDVSEGANNKILLDDFFEGINTFTEDTNPDEAADFVLTYDTSAGTVKKVKPNNFQIVVAGSGISVSGNTVSINTNNAGGIGSYALLRNSTGSTINFGSTASSGLAYAGSNASSDLWESNAVSPSGTWRNVCGNTTSGNAGNGTCFLGIRTA